MFKLKNPVIARLLALVAFVTLMSRPVAQAQGQCTLTTTAQCSDFLASQATLATGSFDATGVANQIETCAASPEFPAACGKCLKRLGQFSKAISNFRNNGMGWSKPNAVYLAEQEDTTRYPAGMMQIPQELITLSDANGQPSADPTQTVGSVLAFPLFEMLANNFKTPEWLALEAKGFRHLVYSSRTVPNPPNRSFRRLLVFVPSENFDRWIQFTLTDISQANSQEVLIDFIAVQKKDIHGADLPQKTLHFRQYNRKYTDGRVTGLELRSGTGDKCYGCHPGGMRSLSPDPGSVSGPEALATVKFYNNTMNSYGKLSFGDAADPAHFGPALGSSKGCPVCHGGTAESPRLPLNWGVWSFGQTNSIDSLKHKMTVDFSMPPGPRLAKIRPIVEMVSNLEPEPSAAQAELLTRLRNVSQGNKYDEILKIAQERQLVPAEDLSSIAAGLAELKSSAQVNYSEFSAAVPGELKAWLTAESCTE